MRYSLYTLLAVLALAVAAPRIGWSQDSIPRFSAVDPANAKVGDVLTVTGENIGKDAVAEVYLTDGKNDFKAVVTSQTGTEIKFKVPKVAPARYRLMVLTKGKEPKLIEQPVKVEIEEGSGATS
ncbi:MAG: IPT/TIG domain-containing protein [Bryobacterales bacterium]|nr:IPT/TIG domain-containing protein [Bryobacterales bacterium]